MKTLTWFALASLAAIGCDSVFGTGAPDTGPVDSLPRACPSMFADGFYIPQADYTWFEAEAACEQLQTLPGSGGYTHLAVFMPLEEASMVVLPPNAQGWVGAIDSTPTGNDFRWVTAEPVSLINFKTGEPDAAATPRCAYLYGGTLELGDAGCTQAQRRAVCECDQFEADPVRVGTP